MGAWQVKLFDPMGHNYLSALEIRSLYIKRYINSAVFTLLLLTLTGIADLRNSGPVPVKHCGVCFYSLFAGVLVIYRFCFVNLLFVCTV